MVTASTSAALFLRRLGLEGGSSRQFGKHQDFWAHSKRQRGQLRDFSGNVEHLNRANMSVHFLCNNPHRL
ncbi:Hypothetical protein NTJ_04132 [Nesidiocoris tenuis]|uniref:Uncharacterized protein n=1 Tax=Nesidiocoris tenuis TaxID=355587 RepID=A0ABN7AH09_9HEMI|nr:Hypothetical protein NTJ_04132 [Nesidiocoris tenuis]